MQENDTTETPAETPPDLRFKPNDWAVASAAQTLMGKLTPGAFQFALALAGHVEYSGAHFKVWPGQRRLKSMCGIGSFTTIRRIVAELEQHKLVSTRHDGGRNTTRYTLNYVTVPDWVKVEIPKAVDSVAYGVSAPESGALHQSSGKAVESSPISAPLSVGHDPQFMEHTYIPLKYLQEEEERRDSEGERGRHDPPPRIDLKTIDSHPLSSAFEDKSTHVQKAKVEIVDPVAEAKRKADYKALWDVSGPVAREHLEKTERERDLLSSRNAQDGLGDTETQLTH